jgi:hypothetical protein
MFDLLSCRPQAKRQAAASHQAAAPKAASGALAASAGNGAHLLPITLVRARSIGTTASVTHGVSITGETESNAGKPGTGSPGRAGALKEQAISSRRSSSSSFKCTELGCNKAYSALEDMRVHRETRHSGIRWLCPHADCKRSQPEDGCSSRAALTIHVFKRHVGSLPRGYGGPRYFYTGTGGGASLVADMTDAVQVHLNSKGAAISSTTTAAGSAARSPAAASSVGRAATTAMATGTGFGLPVGRQQAVLQGMNSTSLSCGQVAGSTDRRPMAVTAHQQHALAGHKRRRHETEGYEGRE